MFYLTFEMDLKQAQARAQGRLLMNGSGVTKQPQSNTVGETRYTSSVEGLEYFDSVRQKFATQPTLSNARRLKQMSGGSEEEE